MAILVVVLGVGILHLLLFSLLLNDQNRNIPSRSRIFPLLIYGQPLLIHGESAAIGTDHHLVLLRACRSDLPLRAHSRHTRRMGGQFQCLGGPCRLPTRFVESICSCGILIIVTILSVLGKLLHLLLRLCSRLSG